MSVVEKKATQPVRRSRRAASLTAQVLWNIQIEDDVRVDQQRSKPSPTDSASAALPRTHKRVSSEAVAEIPEGKGGAAKVGKKPRTSSDNKWNRNNNAVFGKVKPLQPASDRKGQKKLTASVAPLIKPATLTPTLGSVQKPNVMAHANPILLLPVALQPSQATGHVTAGSVGSLPLWTLPSSDLISCFGLNKSIAETNVNLATNPWQRPTVGQATVSTNTDRVYNQKIRAPGYSQRAVIRSKPYQSVRANSAHSNQEEPLNLKLGETKVPGSFRRAIAPAPTALPLLRCTLTAPARSDLGHRAGAMSGAAIPGNAVRGKIKETNPVKAFSSRSKATARKTSERSSPVLLSATARCGHATKNSKCPSPEYVCSSPDVDDVHLDARHSCNRAHINLRNKAVPPPGSADYENFKLKAEQEARLRPQNSFTAQQWRARESRSDSDDDKPLFNPDVADLMSDDSLDDANNGWKWYGKPYDAMVYSVEAGKHVRRRCYPSMKRRDEDGQEAIVMVRDCVFLRAGESDEAPYVAKVTGLWEKPRTGAMTMSLLWYYRPEHTEDSRLPNSNVCEEEIFSSRHQDEISVACVEDRCHVLSYSEYCRVQGRFRCDKAGRAHNLRRVVPHLPRSSKRSRNRPTMPGESPVDSNNVFFCRKHYDVKGKRVLKCLPLPTSLIGTEHGRRNASVST